MLKAFLFVLFIFILMVFQLLLPKCLLFVPILSLICLFISPKWGIGLLFTFGLWLDSMYNHPLVIPYTFLLVLLGVTIELFRSKFSKRLHIFGFYIVLIYSLVIFFVNVHMQEISMYLFGKLLLILIINVIVYYALYWLWQKMNK